MIKTKFLGSQTMLIDNKTCGIAPHFGPIYRNNNHISQLLVSERNVTFQFFGNLDTTLLIIIWFN